MDMQIGHPEAADWLLFAALNIAALAWYPRWATRRIRTVNPDDHEQRRAAAYWTLCVLLVVAMLPWIVLGLTT